MTGNGSVVLLEYSLSKFKEITQEWCLAGRWILLLAESIRWLIAFRVFDGYVRGLLVDEGGNVRFYSAV